MASSDPSPLPTPGGPEAMRREIWVGVDQSSVAVVNLLSGILVWGGVGWLADRWLGTFPWFFGVGVFVGFGAGLYLVWLRSARQYARDALERSGPTRVPRMPRGTEDVDRAVK